MKKEISKARMIGSAIAGVVAGAIVVLSLSGRMDVGGVSGERVQVEQTQSQGSIEIASDSYVSAEFEKIYETPGVKDVFYVSLNVQNKTDKTIWVYLDKASVNKESVSMVSTGVPLYIAPGNSGRTGFIFPMAQLSIESASDVRNITFDLVAADEATLDEIDRVKGISIDL
ncbi:hypothetical protein [Hominenteromicrobium sp.]|uniref:hypothetical protein n=1 Tax=Hominenteromicrobium sp. TaxID=3073581 RepID=UPI003AEF20C6